MDSGFIKLHRRLLDSDVFASQTALKIWIWCLMRANYKSRKVPVITGRGETIVELESGQFIFGRNRASEELGISSSTIYRWIKRFEVDKMIAIKTNTHYSIITVCNYEIYQDNPQDDEQPTIQPTIQPMDTDKNSKNSKNIYKEKIYKKEIRKNTEEANEKRIKQHQKDLEESIRPYIEKYGRDMCNDFYIYWSEPNEQRTKVRYKLQKTWEISRRLLTWSSNQDKFGNGKTTATEKQRYSKL